MLIFGSSRAQNTILQRILDYVWFYKKLKEYMRVRKWKEKLKAKNKTKNVYIHSCI